MNVKPPLFSLCLNGIKIIKYLLSLLYSGKKTKQNKAYYLSHEHWFVKRVKVGSIRGGGKKFSTLHTKWPDFSSSLVWNENISAQFSSLKL